MPLQYKMFKFFYFLISFFVYIILLPLIIYKSRFPRYKDRIPSQFFLKNNPPFNKEGIWTHSCSLGETNGLEPIISNLNDIINMTVVTNTAFAKAQKITKDKDNVRYLPFEVFLPFWIKKQKILIVTEAEYWYMLFATAKAQGIKTMLINARISDKHYKSYKKLRWFYKKILANIDIIFAQSQKDKNRLIELGAKNVIVAGNTKLVNLPKKSKDLPKPKDRMIVASSTHSPEEQLVLNAWKRDYGILVIVPRHPERFDEVDTLIKSYLKDKNLTYHRYTQKNNFESDIVLVDMIGELINIYAISDVVILGGGHNPIEPSFFNNILITGKLVYNQTSLYECIKNPYIIKNENLKDVLAKLNSLEKSKIVVKGDIQPIIDYINKEVYRKTDEYKNT